MNLKTCLATSHGDFGLSQTLSRIGLEHVLGDNATASWSALLLLLPIGAVAILGFEILDQGILETRQSQYCSSQ
jgi:hypothetical protein